MLFGVTLSLTRAIFVAPQNLKEQKKRTAWINPIYVNPLSFWRFVVSLLVLKRNQRSESPFLLISPLKMVRKKQSVSAYSRRQDQLFSGL